MTSDTLMRFWGGKWYGDGYWIAKPPTSFDEDLFLVNIEGPGIDDGPRVRHVVFRPDGKVVFKTDFDT